MKTFMLTGATGFVGSALGARLMASGNAVIALSRNDPDGSRTRRAVLDAAVGCGLDISDRMESGLRVLNAGDGPLADVLDRDVIRDVDVFWHCAAEMTYSSSKLVHAFRTNVCDTVALYRKLAAQETSCRRFYYVSTAYTAGMRGGDAAELLHIGNLCINTYQLTKWCAEQSLFALHAEQNLPVTIFRPTIVVGHSQSGWTRRNGFGMYMFVDAINAARRLGITTVRFNLPDDVRPDMVPVDRLVEDMAGLTFRAAQGAEFEIFQCSGGRELTTRQVVSTIGETAGVSVEYGAPLTAVEHRIDRAIDANRPFASTDWAFGRSRLDEALGRRDSRPPVTKALLERLVTWYRQGPDADMRAAHDENPEVAA
jgi:nucleoside-diphosphate-sugar epimerase